MTAFSALATFVGLSFTSGIRLYLTVALVGLATKFDLLRGLPAEFEVFGQSWLIALSLFLAAIEFIADKVQWLDSIWDSIHTFMRPICVLTGKFDPDFHAILTPVSSCYFLEFVRNIRL